MKAADAASATIIANGQGEAPSSLAMASVTGAICTAVAVLAMNKPSTDDEQRRQYETWRGGSNQADDRVGSEVDPSRPL